MNRPVLVCAAGALSLLALSACSSGSADSTASSESAASSPSTSDVAEVVAAGSGDVAAACAAIPDLDDAVATYPGADPDAPPASAADLADWAARTQPALDIVAANAPGELSSSVEALSGALAGAAAGTPIDADDAAVTQASVTLDRWGYDSCGFTTLDVTNTGAALTGVPATLPAGPVSLSFTNDSPPDQAGFVLLVTRVADGAEVTTAQVADGSVDLESVASSFTVAQPTEESPVAYTATTLLPGRYLVVTPLGAPPEFGAILAAEFTVA